MIKTSLLSDQVDKREVEIILRELDDVIARGIQGDVTEFGCYVGTTSVFLAERLRVTDRMLYLYDSFEGLPSKTREDESPAGVQFVAGALAASKKELIKNLRQAGVPTPMITKKWFADLIDTDIPNKIAFAFLDGDYYQSIHDPLKCIKKHLAPGATIIVDDYANEALPGAARAVD